MKTKFAILVMTLLSYSTATIAQSTTFNADTQKSVVSWLAKKVTGEHKGTVNLSSGEFVIDQTATLISSSFDIDMTSIKNIDLTDPEWNGKLINHLKSEDFFSVVKFPKAHFQLTAPVKIVKGNALIKGNLTIKGITKPLEFKAVFVQTDGVYAIYANIIVDRTKYDIKYGSGSFFDDLGDKTIYDEFNINLNIVTIK